MLTLSSSELRNAVYYAFGIIIRLAVTSLYRLNTVLIPTYTFFMTLLLKSNLPWEVENYDGFINGWYFRFVTCINFLTY